MPEPDQAGQGEAEQGDQCHGQPQPHGRESRRGQVDIQHRGHQVGQQQLRDRPDEDARDGGEHGQHKQAQAIDPPDHARGGAQRSHQGGGVLLDPVVVARRDYQCRTGEQNGDHRRQAEEAAGPLEGGLEGRLAGLRARQMQAAVESGLEPVDALPAVLGVAGDQQGMLDPAGVGDQPGRLKVVVMDHQAGRGLREDVAHVRLAFEHGGDGQPRLAHLDRIAHVDVQRQHRPSRQPALAGRRPLLDRAGLAIGLDAQRAAQGVGVVDGLQADEQGPVPGDHHRREGQLSADVEPEGLCLFGRRVERVG